MATHVDNLVTGQPASDSPHTGTDQRPAGLATTSPTDDRPLLELERQFNAVFAELHVAKSRMAESHMAESLGRRGRCCAGPPTGRLTTESRAEGHGDEDVATQQIESILARLSPIERAIMHTPARTIEGLGVKARHAASVVSHYWEAPAHRIDWEAQAVRLLIEAVCDLARSPLSIRDATSDE
jgi:hypothetical protein